MFSFLVTLIVFLILGMIVFQTIYVLSYRSVLAAGAADTDAVNSDAAAQTAPPSLESDVEGDGEAYAPPAAIVLCLKGADASLGDCLTGLVSQDYPDFRIHIIVDSPDDPANEIVKEFFATVRQSTQIEYLQNPLNTCSLKCSAIAQAVQSLPDDVEVVAFVDGDAVVDEAWLSDLVAPLSDKKIGATTGNRWYSPVDNALGSWVRKIWNAAAVVQMERYQIAWGGSLAIRTDVIEQCGLVEKWRRAFCEDTLLTDAMNEKKLQLHRVPNLVIEDRSAVSLPNAFQWIVRQLLTVRLHHRAWKHVMLHGVATGIASIVAPLLIVVLFVAGATSAAWLLLKAVLAYQVFNFGLLWMIGKSNRQAIESRNSHNGFETVGGNRWLEWGATLVTQIVQPLAVWDANSTEKVEWRGVKYKVKSKDAIKMLGAGTSPKNTSPNASPNASPIRDENGAADGNAAVMATSSDQASAAPDSAPKSDDDAQSEDNYLPGSRFSKRSRN